MKYTSKFILNGQEYMFAAPSEQWRQPGANTILYLPLNSTNTYTDQSGLNISTSNTGVSFGTYQGVDCAYFDGNSHIQVDTLFDIPKPCTVLAWTYNTQTSGWTDGKIFDARDGTNLFIAAINYDDQTYQLQVGDERAECMPMYDSQWILYAGVRESEYNHKLYIKGNGINDTGSNTNNQSQFTPTYINVGNEWNNGASRYYYGGMSQLIVENRERTAQEIEDYYNKTKSLYGIS